MTSTSVQGGARQKVRMDRDRVPEVSASAYHRMEVPCCGPLSNSDGGGEEQRWALTRRAGWQEWHAEAYG